MHIRPGLTSATNEKRRLDPHPNTSSSPPARVPFPWGFLDAIVSCRRPWGVAFIGDPTDRPRRARQMGFLIGFWVGVNRQVAGIDTRKYFKCDCVGRFSPVV